MKTASQRRISARSGCFNRSFGGAGLIQTHLKQVKKKPGPFSASHRQSQKEINDVRQPTKRRYSKKYKRDHHGDDGDRLSLANVQALHRIAEIYMSPFPPRLFMRTIRLRNIGAIWRKIICPRRRMETGNAPY